MVVNFSLPVSNLKYYTNFTANPPENQNVKTSKDGEKDNNHKLSRHAYGCIITGNEYEYQCLGCGKEWKQRSVCGEKKSI